MTYTVKIPGTRYVIQLELVGDIWVIALLVDGSVEEKKTLKHLSKRLIEEAILELLETLPIPLNAMQQQLINTEMEKQTNHLYSKPDPVPEGRPVPQFGNISEETHVKPSSVSQKTTERKIRISGGGGIKRGGHQTDRDQIKEKVAEKLQSQSLGIQQSVVSEFQKEILGETVSEQEEINMSEIQRTGDDSSQIQELIRTYQEVQDSIKSLDKRVAALERITYKMAQLLKNLNQ